MTCPTCLRQLRVASWYKKLNFYGGIVMTGILCFLFGFRGAWLFIAIVVGSLPGILLWAIVLGHTVSMRFEPYPPGSPAPPRLEHKS
jgi:hypothetical protein